jgi:hypothetical protein
MAKDMAGVQLKPGDRVVIPGVIRKVGDPDENGFYLEVAMERGTAAGQVCVLGVYNVQVRKISLPEVPVEECLAALGKPVGV